MSNSEVELSIIIINYRSAQLVCDCIQSIYTQTLKTAFEIIVVDNFSEDNSLQTITSRFPAIRSIQMSYNSGFARGNNAAIKVAQGKYILLLNGDTIILDNALDKTVQLMNQHEQFIGCGIQLLNPDGTYQISGAHFKTGGLNTLLPLPYLGRFIRFLGYKLKSRVPSITKANAVTEVDWIVGAFLMVRKDVILKSGLMDEDFFMYAEEIEWCSRLRRYGRLSIFGEPTIIHIGGGTTSDYYDTEENENSRNLWNLKGRQILISSMLRIRKQFGLFWFFIILGFYLFDILIFLLGLSFEKLFKGKRARFTWKNFSDYVVNMKVLLGYVGRMIRNKPYFYKVQ